METIKVSSSANQEYPEEFPSLFIHSASNSTKGFDNVEVTKSMNRQCIPTSSQPSDSPSFTTVKVVESTTFHDQLDAFQSNLFTNVNDISISMPCSPSRIRTILFSDEDGTSIKGGRAGPRAASLDYNVKPKHVKSYSNGHALEPTLLQQKTPRTKMQQDKQYNSFKTWSGKLERQISHIGGKQPNTEPPVKDSQSVVEPIPVDRYFAALEGPELETLKDSEELLLPADKKWPFLLRFPISTFGICLGVSSQAILWKAVATSLSMRFLHINLDTNLFLWCISVALTAAVSIVYTLKIIFYFEAVRREYYHPIRVNFFFAPWISLLSLALAVPPSIVKELPAYLWYVLMAPLFCLELKIYGQWMSGGRRRLSRVANPSNHLALVGNFVGALLGAKMGLIEGPIFFFAVGVAHYVVLFVTLYQRLPTNETLSKELHPVFFLFIAAPSVASMAWTKLVGTFDYGSRICYFIAMFLYVILAVRVNFFRGFKFSLSWWAYTFPMTSVAVATIKYSKEVKNPVTQTLSVILSAISSLAVIAVLVSTIAHAFVVRDLFPNDVAIAISRKRIKDNKNVHLRFANSDARAIDHSLKPTSPDDRSDIEMSVNNGNFIV